MNAKQIIKTRKSVRTFDGEKITEEDRQKLLSYINTIENPYGIPVEFIFLDSQKYGLSSPVIEGEDFYIAAKVPDVEHCEEAFGYSFEKMILYAWSIGIGTTWVGGTLNRNLFEKAADTKEGEFMMIVTPVGYPSDNRSKVDATLRSSVRGDERFPVEELFFEGDFTAPITETEDWIEAVRWAPSAANRQPWRVVKDGDKYHFFVQHTIGYSSGVAWHVQKIDVGIAICHFMCVCGGNLIIEDPKIRYDENTEYIATIVCKQ